MAVSEPEDIGYEVHYRAYCVEKVPGGAPHVRWPADPQCMPASLDGFDQDVWGVVGRRSVI